jgi:hypothetical protein
MQKTKKVKRQNKGELGKKKRIFTIKNKGGVWNPFNRTAKVAPVPQPYSPIRSRPPSSTNEGSVTTDSHDTRFDMGDIYPLNEEVKDQHISPGSALTMSPAIRQPLTDPRTLAQMNMIQQNKPQPLIQSPTSSTMGSNTTSSTTPPNDKCLLYVSNWLKNRDYKNRIATVNRPTFFEYTNFTNDMENKGIAKAEIDACLQYSGITSHLSSSMGSPIDSAMGSTTSTLGTGSTEYSTIVPDTVSTSSSTTSSDKTYIVKYKTVNGTPQEKEVFVQDPATQTYTRYLFDQNGNPRSCYHTVPYAQVGNHLNGSIQTTECDISLKPLGSVR